MPFLDPLPLAWLGALALCVLWVNLLLVVAQAWKQRASLGETRARLIDARRRGALVAGTVERGDGPADALVSRVVPQLGRAITDGADERVLFTDRGVPRVELHGGVVRLASDERIEIATALECELWLPDEWPSERDAVDFADAYARASTNRGLGAELVQRVEPGAAVFVLREEARVLLAALDPIAFCDRMRARAAFFALATVVAGALATLVALWPPAFGAVSKVGGVLCVACFLGIPPLATSLRDGIRLPPARLVGGLWRKGE